MTTAAHKHWLGHPITGEALDSDNADALKRALEETEEYLRRPEVRRMWNARDAIQARLVEINAIVLPRPSKMTDKQRRVERCPRCKSIIDLPSGGADESADAVGDTLEPEPAVQPDPQVRAEPARAAEDLVAASPAASGSESQTTLLPTGQRTPEQEAALGVDIFGERVEPEPLPPKQGTTAPAQDAEEGEAPDGGASPDFDPITLAGAEIVPKGNRAGKTVDWVVENDPEWCLWYLDNGLTEKLKAAITTVMYAKRPDLMEGR